MNFVRLSFVSLCLLFAAGNAFSGQIFYWGSNLAHDNGVLKVQGITCEAALQRAHSQGIHTQYDRVLYEGSTGCQFYYYNGSDNKLTISRRICDGQTTLTLGANCSNAAYPDDECQCFGETECRIRELASDPALSECYSASQNPNSIYSFIDKYTPPDGQKCGDYYAVCDQLDNLCQSYQGGTTQVCKDYCDLPENSLNPACLYNDCTDSTLENGCEAPTPNHCWKNRDSYGCKNWCSDPDKSDFAVCDGSFGYPVGGMPSGLGTSCRDSDECLQASKDYYNRECRNAVDYTWDYTDPINFSLTCSDSDNNTASYESEDGDLIVGDNTTDSIALPDRDSDPIPDDSGWGLLLDSQDNSVKALNNVNENLNSIETETRISGEKLSDISTSLDNILFELQLQNISPDPDSGSGSGSDVDLQPVSDGLSDLQSILTDSYNADREDANPITESPLFVSSDISELEEEQSLSDVTFDDSGFILDTSCPASINVTVLGFSLSFSFDVFCQLASYINAIISAFAYFWAGRIFLREVS